MLTSNDSDAVAVVVVVVEEEEEVVVVVVVKVEEVVELFGFGSFAFRRPRFSFRCATL